MSRCRTRLKKDKVRYCSITVRLQVETAKPKLNLNRDTNLERGNNTCQNSNISTVKDEYPD